MSFDPSSSLVRICSEGITGKDAHAIGFSVVYGHEKWETNAWNLMAQRQGKYLYNWSVLYT